MERPLLIDIHLERKEGATSLTLQHIWHAAAKHSPNSTITMLTATVRCVIPAVNNDGVRLDIPRSAWSDLEKVAEEEFGASLEVAFLEGRDGDDGVPSAMYVLAAVINVEHFDAFVARLDPLIDDVIERHAQVPALPVR